MKSSKKLISSVLLISSLVSNFVHAKIINKAYYSEGVSYYNYDNDDDYYYDLQDKTQDNSANLVLPIVAMMMIIAGTIYYCCAGSSQDKSTDIIPQNNNENLNRNVTNAASEKETESKCLATLTLKNGVQFSVFFGDILEWQNGQKAEGKKFIVCSPDNSNLHPDSGLANKICKKIGGHYENKDGKDKDHWVYPDQLDLRSKLRKNNSDKSDELKVGSVILGKGSGDFDVCHLVGPCVSSSGAKLSVKQKQKLKDAYLNAIKEVANTDNMGINQYSAINMCSVSDAIFNVTSAESAEALAAALLEVDEKQFPSGVKCINLVIHSKFNNADNDNDKNLKRSDVFISTIKSKFGNDGNGKLRVNDMRS